MVEKFTPQRPPGDASKWTPRQALLAALAECENMDAVVIIGRYGSESKAWNCSNNAFERDGLIFSAFKGLWT